MWIPHSGSQTLALSLLHLSQGKLFLLFAAMLRELIALGSFSTRNVNTDGPLAVVGSIVV